MSTVIEPVSLFRRLVGRAPDTILDLQAIAAGGEHRVAAGESIELQLPADRLTGHDWRLAPNSNVAIAEGWSPDGSMRQLVVMLQKPYRTTLRLTELVRRSDNPKGHNRTFDIVLVQ